MLELRSEELKCLSDLIRRGRKLDWKTKEARSLNFPRWQQLILNRVIFDGGVIRTKPHILYTIQRVLESRLRICNLFFKKTNFFRVLGGLKAKKGKKNGFPDKPR